MANWDFFCKKGAFLSKPKDFEVDFVMRFDFSLVFELDLCLRYDWLLILVAVCMFFCLALPKSEKVEAFLFSLVAF